MLDTDMFNGNPREYGIVLGSFSPMHTGHLDLVMAAKKLCKKGAIIAVCGLDGDRGNKIGLPLERRYEIIKDIFAGDPLVHVVMMKDNDIGIAGYMDKWQEWLGALSRKITEEVFGKTGASKKQCWSLLTKMTVFTGEPSYQKAILALPKPRPNVYLLPRELNPISATKIRTEPLKYWDQIIGTEFKRPFAKRVLIVGTASEGKSTLTMDLARYFGAECTEEFGHTYIASVNGETPKPDDTKLTYDDFISFLDRQYELNMGCTGKLAICDSDAMTTLMYAKYYSMDDRYTITADDYVKIEQHAKFPKYDVIFVVPPKKDSWVQDGSRDCLTNSFDDRKNMYQILMGILGKHYCTEDVVYLNGNFYENFIRARDRIKALMNG